MLPRRLTTLSDSIAQILLSSFTELVDNLGVGAAVAYGLNTRVASGLNHTRDLFCRLRLALHPAMIWTTCATGAPKLCVPGNVLGRNVRRQAANDALILGDVERSRRIIRLPLELRFD